MTESSLASGDQVDSPFDDEVFRALRARQREIMTVLPGDVSSPLMPSIRGGTPDGDPIAIERALRERLEQLIDQNPDLESYLARCRRTHLAELRRSVIERSYRELAGDAPAGMDEELDVAIADIDGTTASPSYEENALLIRFVPLLAYADHYSTYSA